MTNAEIAMSCVDCQQIIQRLELDSNHRDVTTCSADWSEQTTSHLDITAHISTETPRSRGENAKHICDKAKNNNCLALRSVSTAQ